MSKGCIIVLMTTESIDGKLKGGFPSTSIDSQNIISKLRSKGNGPETRNLYSKDGSVVGWFDKSTRTTHLLPGADAATVAHEIEWHASYEM